VCKCSYSECICHIAELNHKPDYKVGDYWKIYGGFKSVVKILIVTKRQVVAEDETGHIYAYKIGNQGYANCGTPQLRTKVDGFINTKE